MRWMYGEMRPGVVLEIVNNQGLIKAEVPGLFNRADQENLPPIMPWPSGGSLNSFSTPKVQDEVWVIFFTDNPEQLFWLRKDNFSRDNITYGGDITNGVSGSAGGNIQDQPGVQILANIESKSDWATIYFDDGSGWVIKNQQAILQLDQEGNIRISNGQPHGTIEINDNGISLGSESESTHPAPLGDRVQELFESIIDMFQTIQIVASANPYTMSISKAIEQKLPNFENAPQYINSNFVTLD